MQAKPPSLLVCLRGFSATFAFLENSYLSLKTPAFLSLQPSLACSHLSPPALYFPLTLGLGWCLSDLEAPWGLGSGRHRGHLECLMNE